MKGNTKLFVGLAFVTLGLTSCKDDYFDQERYDQTIRDAFPVENIDPTHTWSMFGTAHVDVAVNNGSDATYRVAVYKENPHISKQLTRLAEAIVRAGVNEHLIFSYELAHPTAYVVIYNGKGGRSVKTVTLKNNVMSYVDFFGSRIESMSRITRSMAAPVVADITQPYDEAWVATYNQTAKEPNAVNVEDNYDNSYYTEGTPGVEGTPGHYEKGWWNWNEINLYRYTPGSAEYDWIQANLERYFSGNISDEEWAALVAAAERDGYTKFLYYVEGTPGTPATEGYWTYDETFVLNFKITDTWNGGIGVAATEGLTDGQPNGFERTVVVTGTWNITEDQRIGSKGRIIIANGGTVNVAEGKTLNMVNQARLVVLPGGNLTGAGKVEVNNGNAAGEENYNGGNIDVAVFNNNFGKFYNYGDFLVNEYWGGAAESNFYNHHLAAIDHFGIYDSSTANARIFNACQFYVKNDARIRNYEGTNGSALIVGGQLMFSSSEDGTSTPTYVGLEAGALVKANSLYNNGTSWSGPATGGYAVLSIGQFDYMNWEQDHPEQGGYFINNLYVQADTWDNVPEGNGMQQKEDDGTQNYTMSQAVWKFENIVANAGGNGNVVIVDKSDTEYIPASENFELGVSGCTPGFKTDGFEDDDDTQIIVSDSYRFCFEDNFPSAGDYDFNDVVITVSPTIKDNVVTLKVSLDAVGATKVISAAMRIRNLQDGMIESVTCDGNMDEGLTNSPQYFTANDNGNGVYVVPPIMRADFKSDFTMRLFSDAHWTLAGNALNTDTGIRRYMLNTIKNGNAELEAQYSCFSPVEVTYTFTLKDKKNAEIFTQDNLDVFIVEAHNSIKWEVHTVPFKLDQVLMEYANNDKLGTYAGNLENYPWAICAPASFRYPIEWHSICGSKVALTGEYGYSDGQEPYSEFATWAADHTKNTDWYEHPNLNLVY